MSFTIDQAFADHFDSNIQLLSQQFESRLAMTTMMKRGLIGEMASFELLDKTEAQDRPSRHADSPLVGTVHTKRWAVGRVKEWGELLDKDDEKSLLVSPGSSYARTGAAALNRAKDTSVITALRGSAKTGKDGTGSQALPAAQKIAVAAAGLTLSKITETSEKLNNAEFPEDDRFWVYGSQQLTNLLNDTTITSQDFNSVRLLMQGSIDSFMGFKWIRSERLDKTGNDRFNLAYHRSAIGFGMWQDNSSRLTERADKSFSLYVYLWNKVGSVRVEDKGVVEIACLET